LTTVNFILFFTVSKKIDGAQCRPASLGLVFVESLTFVRRKFMTFRSMALVGATFAALAALVASATVLAQGQLGDPDRPSYQGDLQRPDFPGPKQQDNVRTPQPDIGQSPRPDYPGPKQGDAPSQK
jgi:hypothetical protein